MSWLKEDFSPPSSAPIAFFDFCETLVDVQSADRFVDAVRPVSWGEWLRRMAFPVICRLPKPLQIDEKTRILARLRNCDEATLATAARQFLQTLDECHVRAEILERARSLKREGFVIGIVSGGYDAYLRLFAERHGFDFLICNQLKIERNHCAGEIVGRDCMGSEKVRRIQAFLASEGLAPCRTIAFSDDPSDLPLLRFATHGVVILSERKRRFWHPESLRNLEVIDV